MQLKERHYKLTHKLWYSELCMAFRKFARSHSEIFAKYKCSVRKHIDEGICLPVLLNTKIILPLEGNLSCHGVVCETVVVM